MTPDDFRKLIRQATRFGISGLIVTALHAAIAASLVELAQFQPNWANVVAYVIANITSYLLHTFWSFSQRPRAGSWLKFIAVSLIGLGITFVVSSLVDYLGGHYWLGIAAVVISVPPVSFVLHRYWTYR